MAQVVHCQQCGAAHRPVYGQTRFACEWCGAQNTTPDASILEELVVAGTCDPPMAIARTKEILQRRGVRAAIVRARPARWTHLWQVLSDHGDEFVCSGNAEGSRLEASLRMPTARLTSVDDAADAPRLPERPAPLRTPDEIASAARATFEQGDAPLRAVRLVWIPVCDLEVAVAGAHVRGLYLGGSDEVLLEPLPAHATDPPARPGRLLAFGSFTAIALLSGVLVAEPVSRAAVLAVWLAVGLVVWGANMLSRRRRPA